MIKFEINGQLVEPSDIKDALSAQILQQIADNLQQSVGSIRHPVTGEFPVVFVKGDSLDNLSIEVTGSPELVALIQARLNVEQGMDDNSLRTSSDHGSDKVAFLCHGSEDKIFARKLAIDLNNNGVDVFFDEWEIRPGDSIVKKINEGISNCTHFIVVLTPDSINKPWVNAELDAGLIKHIEESVCFIPIRLNLPVNALPPLLRAKHSPSFDDYQANLAELISTIHEISKKPPRGTVPESIINYTQGHGYSPAAESIAKVMVEKSETGCSMDPQLSPDEIRELSKLTDDDIEDAVDELEGQQLVHRHRAFGEDRLGFTILTPEDELFVKFDKYYSEYSPEEDALRIAADLVNNGEDSLTVSALATSYGWRPRRMNPAINYLTSRKLVQTGSEIGCHPWTTFWIRKTPATRRFVKSRS